jgi:hypothetical protein
MLVPPFITIFAFRYLDYDLVVLSVEVMMARAVMASEGAKFVGCIPPSESGALPEKRITSSAASSAVIVATTAGRQLYPVVYLDKWKIVNCHVGKNSRGK